MDTEIAATAPQKNARSWKPLKTNAIICGAYTLLFLWVALKTRDDGYTGLYALAILGQMAINTVLIFHSLFNYKKRAGIYILSVLLVLAIGLLMLYILSATHTWGYFGREGYKLKR
jgi:hypothetical protein